MHVSFPRITRRVALAIGLSGVLSVCAAQGSAQTLNVGATATGIPFTFLNVKTNAIEGMMVDTAQAVAKAAGLQVAIQQNTFAALIPALTSHKIDIISAAMLKTPARAQVVGFTDPVYSYGEGLVIKADDARSYASLDDLKGEVVGAQVGTIFVDMLNKKGIFKEVRTYDSVADMMRDISLGRIKAGLGDQPIIAYQIAQKTFTGVKLAPAYKSQNVGDVCLVVRKEDTALAEKLNKAIAQIKADGTLQKIVQKWGI